MSIDQQEIVTGVTTVSTPSDREVVSERVFDAPRERVFAAFTDPALVAQWWGPHGTKTTVELMDVRPGGRWRFVIRNDSDGRENGFVGAYREVSEPERIVQTFEWDGTPGHVVVETVTFEELGQRTRVRTNSLFHTTEERDGMVASGMERGLTESHERLTGLLTR
jgi:uncharacterized protein YndB with AHSA1/START domain